MKNLTAVLAMFGAVIAFVGLSFTVKPGATLRVDTLNSNVQWTAYKVTGQHSGVINIKSGALIYDDKGFFSGGSFDIDMTTVKCTDLEGGMAGKLEGHLKSDDFFGVANPWEKTRRQTFF